MTTQPSKEQQMLQVLRQAMATEKEAGDSQMRKPWSAERDSFANQHYYAADVLQDVIEQIEALT